MYDVSCNILSTKVAKLYFLITQKKKLIPLLNSVYSLRGKKRWFGHITAVIGRRIMFPIFSVFVQFVTHFSHHILLKLSKNENKNLLSNEHGSMLIMATVKICFDDWHRSMISL